MATSRASAPSLHGLRNACSTKLPRLSAVWVYQKRPPVVSCYEAGREGFWLHRFLLAHSITNHVVDSSAIEVSRRQRRAKSDGLDVRKLLSMLMRYHHGERHVWQVVKVPSVEAEDQRHLHRGLETLKQERASTTTRLKGLLSSQGIRLTSLARLGRL